MKKIIVFAIFSILIAACASPAPQATPTPEPTITPLPTNTAVPTDTPEPSPTPDPLIFKDDFESAKDADWQIVKQNEKTWSLEKNPGWLEIIAGKGGAPAGTVENMFLRAIPEGNFELETKLNFKPKANFQIAGLLIYESGANMVQFGRAFCKPSQACVGDGLYFDLVSGGGFGSSNFSTEAPDTDVIYLRLRREGSTYTAYFSEDGSQWKLVGAQSSEMNAQFVGLVAGQSQSGSVPSQFDYFTINQLP